MADLVLMKLFEASPKTFGRRLRRLTHGVVDEVHAFLAQRCRGARDVLDLGCGAGELAALVAAGGARVVAIDRDPGMVAVAEAEVLKEGREAEVAHCNAFELRRRFAGRKFDRVVMSLVLSEQSDEEREWIVAECSERLRPGGRLLVADEFVPEGRLQRAVFRWRRLVARFVAFWGLSLQSIQAEKRWRSWYYVVVEAPLIFASFFVTGPITRPLAVSSWRLPPGIELVAERRFARDLRVLELVKT